MAEQVTIKGQKYTIVQRHTWGQYPNVDKRMKNDGILDTLYMHKPAGQALYSVHIVANPFDGSSLYAKVRRIGR